MKNTVLALSSFVFLIISCKNSPLATTPQIEHQKFSKKVGNCVNEGDRCFIFEVNYPKVTSGSQALTDSITAWVNSTVYMLSVQSEETPSGVVPMAQSADKFYELWKSVDGLMGASYAFEGRDTLLAINSDLVSIRMDYYFFTGGAHPNHFTELGVFDAQSGKKISVNTYIKDKNAVLPLLDIAYKAEKQDAFNDGFTYETGQITFPEQTAVTEKGVLFHYNTYEIAPYVMGDADIFLTWTDLGQAAQSPF